MPLHLVKRIEGQIRGVLKMMEEGQDCRDVVSQLSASRTAIDRTMGLIVSENLVECVPMITNPDCFIQWYPFATGELELRVGGKIGFDDGEGATYEGVITKLTSPYAFEFQEVN